MTGEKLRPMTGKKSLNWFNINIFTPSKPHGCCTASPATFYTVWKKTQHPKKSHDCSCAENKNSNECHKPYLETKVKNMGSNSIQSTHPSLVAHWTEHFNTQPLQVDRLSRKYRPFVHNARASHPIYSSDLAPSFSSFVFWWQMFRKQGRSEAYCQAVIK